MRGTWEAEIRKLKRQYNKEILAKPKEGRKIRDSSKSEFQKIMELLKSLLLPVVEVFREERLTTTLQPHIHEYKSGYTLVVPIAEQGIRPLILKLEFELKSIENGHILKVVRETPSKIPAPETIIKSPITEERIQNEIRIFLNERQSIILSIKK